MPLKKPIKYYNLVSFYIFVLITLGFYVYLLV